MDMIEVGYLSHKLMVFLETQQNHSFYDAYLQFKNGYKNIRSPEELKDFAMMYLMKDI